MHRFRRARLSDIATLQSIRHSVPEAEDPGPRDLPDTLYAQYLERRGRGWLAMAGHQEAGFVIVSLVDQAVWALYVNPAWQGQGLGRRLLQIGCHHLFSQGARQIRLTTASGVPALGFYQHLGWRPRQAPEGELVELVLDRPTLLRRRLAP
ncbi:GNAT family N-acetyltransferase [Ferrimonas balearica]|uniref:GNAT family N-acetyltransferase n=1 Tax=Ferrimonas balearica TaxID=44012 RepID=UPI001C99C156|nr:GNAT family N-acetyltransferase [Ferrimonas balearica]MBY5991252.1 GNAT family N-acetyltransferase [Ferrimonas balearica]